MSDSFGFTLHSPLTQEDWNKISDVEHENTMSVTFQTPQGRQVKYIKCDVLDKIKAEILLRDRNVKDVRTDGRCFFTADEIFEIIDKYRNEVSE